MLQNLGTHQQIGRLLLAHLSGFRCTSHGSSEMAVLTKTLHQNCAQGGMGFHDQDAGRFLAAIRRWNHNWFSCGYGSEVARSGCHWIGPGAPTLSPISWQAGNRGCC